MLSDRRLARGLPGRYTYRLGLTGEPGSSLVLTLVEDD